LPTRISITNNAIGTNSRINQNGIDQSTNTVSGAVASAAGHNQLSDPSLPHTRFRKREEAVGAMTFRPLKSFFPTADELLQQDLPTLGKVLLTHLNSYRGQNTVYQHAGLNRGYFRAMLENRSIGLGPLPKEPEYQARQPEVTKRMMEAWNWLERQGLLIHNDEQVADWFTISSDGEKYLDQDKAPNPLLQPSSALLDRDGNGREFDVFISHSSVDKPYVAPLVSALEAAEISVWFDKTTMEWGDSLRSEIDRGLAACRYGIVVFSKAFLKKKKWTEHELNALFAREEPGKKGILPIWHGITRDDLIEYSPAFADRLAKNSITDSYADIVESLLSMLGRPNLVSSRASAEPVKSPHLAAPVANAIVAARYAKEPTPPAARDARQRENPTHNVVFLSAAFVKIAYSGPGYSPRTDGMHSFSEIEGTSKGDMIGLVARFRNEAIYGQEITTVRAVRAHLKLLDWNNQEIGTGYSSALWLGHPSDTFDLVPNGRGGSVLVCWGSKTKARVSWKTRVAIDRLRDNDIELRDGYPSRAEVTLLDSNHRPLLKPIVLKITKTAGELSVAARQ
jgi:hypothetical protein